MTSDEHDVYLQDQIPRFRSGRRRVAVLQIGPKWVRLQCGTKTARIPYRMWVNILASSAKMANRSNPEK